MVAFATGYQFMPRVWSAIACHAADLGPCTHRPRCQPVWVAPSPCVDCGANGEAPGVNKSHYKGIVHVPKHSLGWVEVSSGYNEIIEALGLPAGTPVWIPSLDNSDSGFNCKIKNEWSGNWGTKKPPAVETEGSCRVGDRELSRGRSSWLSLDWLRSFLCWLVLYLTLCLSWYFLGRCLTYLSLWLTRPSTTANWNDVGSLDKLLTRCRNPVHDSSRCFLIGVAGDVLQSLQFTHVG